MAPAADLPEVFRDYFGALEEQRHGPRPDNLYGRCFGCGPDHPDGLHVRCFRVDAGVVSPILVPRRYEGPPGAAHGGIVAAYLDEVLARPILGRAQLVARHGRYAVAEGRLEEFGTARVLATARGRFAFVTSGQPAPTP